MKSFRGFSAYLVCCLVILLFTSVAQAGPYLSIKGGASLLDDQLSSTTAGNTTVVNNQSFDTGFAFTGALGYSFDFENGVSLRTEVESMHVENDKASATQTTYVVKKKCKQLVCVVNKGTTQQKGGGPTRGDFVFVNGYMDLPLFSEQSRIHVGGGYDVSGTDAWQAIGGASHKITDSLVALAEFKLVSGPQDYLNPIVMLGAMYHF